MTCEDILATVGDNGRFQIASLVLLGCIFLYATSLTMSNVFVAIELRDFWCADVSRNYYSSAINNSHDQNYTTWKCDRPSDTPLSINTTLTSPSKGIKCSSWRFSHEDSQYNSAAHSIQSHYGFVCHRAYMVELCKSVYMVGLMLGSVFAGALGDRIGRVRALGIALAVSVLMGTLTPLSPHWLLYALGRGVIGIGSAAIQALVYTVLSECVATRVRMRYLSMLSPWGAVGYMLVAVLAYPLTNHVHLELALSAPAGLLLVVLCCAMPESPKWLLARGEFDRAAAALTTIGKWNNVHHRVSVDAIRTKVTADDSPPKPHADAQATTSRVGDLFSRTDLTRVTLMVWLVVAIAYFVYTGLLMSSDRLSADTRLYVIIGNGIEAVWIAVSGYGSDRFGRLPWFAGLSACGVGSCVLCAVLDSRASDDVPSLAYAAFSVVGRLAVSGIMYGTAAYATEVFPTTHRSTATGARYVIARFAAIFAPHVVLLAAVWRPFPFVIYASLCALGGVSLLFLPETRSLVPPDTIPEGIQLYASYALKKICITTKASRAKQQQSVVLSNLV